jgi:hypothetical protein
MLPVKLDVGKWTIVKQPVITTEHSEYVDEYIQAGFAIQSVHESNEYGTKPRLTIFVLVTARRCEWCRSELCTCRFRGAPNMTVWMLLRDRFEQSQIKYRVFIYPGLLRAYLRRLP